MYEVFKRTWWRENKDYPNGLEPHAGKRRHIAWCDTEEEARRLCHAHNADHNPGRYGMKYEIDEVKR